MNVYAGNSNVYIDNTVNRFNYAVCRFLVDNLTVDRQAFDNRFRVASTLYGSDTVFKRIRYAIPAGYTKMIALCEQIDSMKNNYPDNITESGFPDFLVYNAWYARLPGNPGFYRYPLLYEYISYMRSNAEKKFSNFQYQLYTKLTRSFYVADIPASSQTGSPGENQERIKKWIFNNLHWILLCFLVLLLLFLIAVTRVNNRVGVFEDSRVTGDGQVIKIEKSLAILQAKVMDQEKKIKQYDQKLLTIEANENNTAEKFKKVYAKLIALEGNSVTTRPEGRQESKTPAAPYNKQEPIILKEKERILYFPPPGKISGRFSESAGNHVIQIFSIYQFMISKENAHKASFELIPIPRVVDSILTFPEAYLHHACEVKGEASNAKRVKTITPGIAVLEGGEWIIEKPAIIAYE